MSNKFAMLDDFETLSDEELMEVTGGIGGWLGTALNGFLNGMEMWNNGGFPTYNIGGSSGGYSGGSSWQYNPYDDF